MVLSDIGWITVIITLIQFIFCMVFGAYLIIKSEKKEIKPLFYLGIYIIFIGLMFTGNIIDIIWIFSTGVNAPNPGGIIGILCGIWLAPSMFAGIYVMVEINKPQEKRFILSVAFVISILMELLFLLNPMDAIYFVYPSNPGENIIEDNGRNYSVVGFLFLINLSIYILYGVIALCIKGIKTKGLLRKKYFLLAFSVLGANIFFLIENEISSGILLLLAKIGIIFCWIMMYYGIREEKIEIIEDFSDKEVKVEGGMFRIAHAKPKNITEEEIMLYKEKKICLVCKGPAVKYTFICPNCEALYCVKCADALTEMENQCWACNATIDDSKPVKPEKSEEINVDLGKKEIK